MQDKEMLAKEMGTQAETCHALCAEMTHLLPYRGPSPDMSAEEIMQMTADFVTASAALMNLRSMMTRYGAA